MRESTKLQATKDLADAMEMFLDNFAFGVDCPHWPPDVSWLMARAALQVVEILILDQEALRQDGLLGLEEE